jgi:hypothetical protein
MKFSMVAAQPSDNNLLLQKQLGIDNAVHARPACVPKTQARQYW